MKEEQVFFTGGTQKIEGLFAVNEGSAGAVIMHPHSLMGGSMFNNVVDVLVSTFHGQGFSTLRFNFRGVGRSQGSFDDGIGEQEDIKGALAFLRENGIVNVVLAGYSFGAWVTTKLLVSYNECADFIMISPPIDFLAFDFTDLRGRCGHIICGERDQFCSLPRLRDIATTIDCSLDIIGGADHFYFGREKDIRDTLERYLMS